MARTESHLSQILRVSQWLRTATDEETISLFRTWQSISESENTTSVTSLGQFVASIIIKTKSILLTPNTTSKLLEYCQKKPTKNEILIDGVTSAYPCTKTSNVNASTNTNTGLNFYFPLLSLPFDIFNELGWYLIKKDGINLGYCCHGLYNATQNIQFLKTSGFHYLTLNNQLSHKIINNNIDPWSWCVGCYSLTMRYHATRGDDSNVKLIIDKLLGQSKRSSNWFDVLLSSIQELVLSEFAIVAKVFDSIPMETLFAPSIINSVNSGIAIQRPGIKLKFHNNYVVNDFDFGSRYKEYYTSKCESNISKIRRIKSISVTRSSFEIISHFQPNYPVLKVQNSRIEFISLNTFICVFHKNLTQLEVSRISFDSDRILFDCLQQAASDRKYLQITEAIIDDFYDDNNYNDDENESQVKEMKRVLESCPGGVGDFNRVLAQSQSLETPINRLNRVRVNVNYDNINNPNSYYTPRSQALGICCNLMYLWLLKFIEMKSCAINSNQKKKKYMDGIIATNDKLSAVVTGDNAPNIKQLIFNDEKVSANSSYESFLQPFNNIFTNKVSYRLLNWQKTVELLTISFVPGKLNSDKKQYFYRRWTRGFSLTMANIFKHFDNLRRLNITLKFNASMLDYSDSNSNSNNNASSDEDSCSSGDHESISEPNKKNLVAKWIHLFCKEFKGNIDQMIDKLEHSSHSTFKLKFGLMVGDLTDDDPTDAFEYLYYRNKLDKDIYRHRNKSAAKLSVKEKSIAKRNNQKYTIKKNEFCDKYCKQMKKMRQILDSLKTNCKDLTDESFIVWKTAMMKRHE